MTTNGGFDHPANVQNAHGTEPGGVDAREQDARDRSTHDGEGASMVLHEEELRIRTERIPTGRVTFRKRIVTEERTVVVSVRREELEIIEEDLNAASAPGAESAEGRDAPSLTGDYLRGEGSGGSSDLTHGDDGDLEIILYAERPVLTLETVAAERVRVRRGTFTDEQAVTAEVFREEAVVEREDNRQDDRRRN